MLDFTQCFYIAGLFLIGLMVFVANIFYKIQLRLTGNKIEAVAMGFVVAITFPLLPIWMGIYENLLDKKRKIDRHNAATLSGNRYLHLS